MDTFTDRFLHKKNAQEMIQANAAAEAAQLEQMQQRVSEYDSLIQDMRRVNLKASENMDQIQKLLQSSLGKIEEIKADKVDTRAEREALISEMNRQLEELVPQIKGQTEELMTQMKDRLEELIPQIKGQTEELIPQIKGQTEELMTQINTQIDDAFQRSDDFHHRENVKVYRNVQAAMTEELEKQTNALMQEQRNIAKKQGFQLPVSIIIILMVIIDILINLFNIVIKL